MTSYVPVKPEVSLGNGIDSWNLTRSLPKFKVARTVFIFSFVSIPCIRALTSLCEKFERVANQDKHWSIVCPTKFWTLFCTLTQSLTITMLSDKHMLYASTGSCCYTITHRCLCQHAMVLQTITPTCWLAFVLCVGRDALSG